MLRSATGPGSSMLASAADKSGARAIPQNVADWTAVSFGDNYINGDGGMRSERFPSFREPPGLGSVREIHSCSPILIGQELGTEADSSKDRALEMVGPGEGGNLLTGPGHRTLIRRRTDWFWAECRNGCRPHAGWRGWRRNRSPCCREDRRAAPRPGRLPSSNAVQSAALPARNSQSRRLGQGRHDIAVVITDLVLDHGLAFLAKGVDRDDLGLALRSLFFVRCAL
jgi:hypothetical protein